MNELLKQTSSCKKHFFLKYIIVFLAFSLLFGSVSLNPSASPTQTTVCGVSETEIASVYAFADYNISLRNAIYVENCEDNGNIITDLKYSSIEPEKNIYDGWVGIKSSDGETDYKATITIDLGYFAHGITNYFTRVYRNSTISAYDPNEIKFYVSADGSDYTHIGDGATSTKATSDKTSVTYTLSAPETSGRYIKIVYNCSSTNILYINEAGVAAKGNLFRANYNNDGYYIDRQGLHYKIVNGGAEIIGFTKNKSDYSGAISPSEADFNKDNAFYALGIGSDNEVQVISDFIGYERLNYSGTPNNIKYIVIHNTGTIEEETDAKRYNYRMHNSESELSWHYTVDDAVIYHSLADNIAGWHAGSAYNYESIGIEICVNGAPTDEKGNFVFSGTEYDQWVNGKFRKSIKNAAMLTAELLTRYGLDTDSVIQHHDTTDKNCPMWMRYKNGEFNDNGILWKEFLGYVEEYFKLLNGNSPKPKIQPLTKLIIPDYITVYDGAVYPVTSIGHIAFNGLDGAVNIVTLGKHVKSISPDGLKGSGIYRILVPEQNKNFTIDSEGSLFDSKNNMIYSPVAELPNTAPKPKEDSNLVIAEVYGNHYLCIKTPMGLDQIARAYGCEIIRAYTKGGTTLYGSIAPTTDAVIVFADGAKVTVAARGDINGDGCINGMDYVFLKRHYFGSYQLSPSEFFAADINNDGDIDIKDYLSLKRYCFGTFNIYS